MKCGCETYVKVLSQRSLEIGFFFSKTRTDEAYRIHIEIKKK